MATTVRGLSLPDALVAGFREHLYGGRGPGIDERERMALTRDRPTVGGVPTAAAREATHLRTLRARGKSDELELEGRWAGWQFRSLREAPPASALAEAQGPEQPHRGPLLGLVAALVGLRVHRRKS